VHRYVQLSPHEGGVYSVAFRDEQTVTRHSDGCRLRAPDAFARAFDKGFGNRLRSSQIPIGSRGSRLDPLSKARTTLMKRVTALTMLTIVDVPATKVAVMAHRGDPPGSPRRSSAHRLAQATGLSRARARPSHLLCDRHATAPADFIWTCASTDRVVAPETTA